MIERNLYNKLGQEHMNDPIYPSISSNSKPIYIG